MIDPTYDGLQVPVVLLPRFTTLLGQAEDEFPTLPLDVTAFETARITLWRASMQGLSTPTAFFLFEESTDRLVWTPCELTSTSGETIPTHDTEKVVAFPFGRKWFRLRVRLVGGNPALTCWAQGFLIRRQR